MKTHALTMSVAVLFAVFLAGCEEQGSGPLAPDGLSPQFAKPPCPGTHPSCKDDGGDGGGQTVADATVVLSGGFVTPVDLTTTPPPDVPQDVRIQKETKRALSLEDVRDEFGNSTFKSEIALTATRAAALADLHDGGFPGSSGCVVDPADLADTDPTRVEELAEKFTNANQIRFFGMGVDKTRLDLPSDKHGIAHTWTENPNKLFSLRVGSVGLLPGFRATVTVTGGGNIDGDFTVKFSGGAVQVNDRTGQVKDFVKLACPVQAGDEITVTVTRK